MWIVYNDVEKLTNKININTRQCKIHNVFINSDPCSYTYTDPVSHLLDSTADPSFNGEEIDIHYRAALEISNFGELEISVPSVRSPASSGVRPLPKRVPAKISSRFDKLLKLEKNVQYSTSALLQVY
jgi:hypothetical protein